MMHDPACPNLHDYQYVENPELCSPFHVQYPRAHVRDYHLEKWVSRIEKAICAFPSQFQMALDSQDPTLQLPTALPKERFTFYVERGGEERGLAMLRNALSRATAELEAARSTMKRYEAYATDVAQPSAAVAKPAPISRERRSGASSMPLRFRMLPTVPRARLYPKFESAPTIRL
jgi:hypothetical protein